MKKIIGLLLDVNEKEMLLKNNTELCKTYIYNYNWK